MILFLGLVRGFVQYLRPPQTCLITIASVRSLRSNHQGSLNLGALSCSRLHSKQTGLEATEQRGKRSPPSCGILFLQNLKSSGKHCSSSWWADKGQWLIFHSRRGRLTRSRLLNSLKLHNFHGIYPRPCGHICLTIGHKEIATYCTWGPISITLPIWWTSVMFHGISGWSRSQEAILWQRARELT